MKIKSIIKEGELLNNLQIATLIGGAGNGDNVNGGAGCSCFGIGDNVNQSVSCKCLGYGNNSNSGTGCSCGHYHFTNNC